MSYVVHGHQIFYLHPDDHTEELYITVHPTKSTMTPEEQAAQLCDVLNGLIDKVVDRAIVEFDFSGAERGLFHNLTNRWFCRACDDIEPHTHWHDTAHGIVETHMAGTERFVCDVCGLTTHARDEGSRHFVFDHDRPLSKT